MSGTSPWYLMGLNDYIPQPTNMGVNPACPPHPRVVPPKKFKKKKKRTLYCEKYMYVYLK